jgi:hypothetical protein
MYVKKLTDLHLRSIAALQMINSAKNAIENCRDRLYRYDNSIGTICFAFTRKELLADVKKYQAIRDRLVCWYADIMQRLFSEAMFRTGKGKNVVELAEDAFVKLAEQHFS